MATKHGNLKAVLEAKIRSGVYRVGDMLPSEAELTAQFSLSRNTVRQALKDLENAGFLLRQRGKGTFIRHDGRLSSRKAALFLYNTSDLCNPVTINMVEGFCSVLEPEGYIIDILLSPRTSVTDDIRLLAEKYSGFAIGTQYLDEITVSTLDKLDIPWLFIKNYLPGRSDPGVRLDFFKAGFIAAEHLHQCGCRRIGLIHPGKGPAVAGDFYNGVCAAAMEYGMFLKKKHIFETGSYDQKELAAIGTALIRCPDLPEGIIAATDMMALELLKIFKQHGISVPDQVMITGCNDASVLPKISEPPLTTVAMPMRECGKLAAEMFLGLIHGKQPEIKTLPPTLIRRGTTINKTGSQTV